MIPYHPDVADVFLIYIKVLRRIDNFIRHNWSSQEYGSSDGIHAFLNVQQYMNLPPGFAWSSFPTTTQTMFLSTNDL